MISRIGKGNLVLAMGLLAAVFLQDQCCADEAASAPTNTPKVVSVPEKAIKLQTTCPVMGGAIDKAVFVDSDGKRIYMCCKGCIAAVKKDPAKYIKILEDAGVTLDSAPKADKTSAPVKE